MHPDYFFRIGMPHPVRIGYVDRLCSFHKVTQNHFIKIKECHLDHCLLWPYKIGKKPTNE